MLGAMPCFFNADLLSRWLGAAGEALMPILAPQASGGSTSGRGWSSFERVFLKLLEPLFMAKVFKWPTPFFESRMVEPH